MPKLNAVALRLNACNRVDVATVYEQLGLVQSSLAANPVLVLLQLAAGRFLEICARLLVIGRSARIFRARSCAGCVVCSVRIAAAAQIFALIAHGSGRRSRAG